LSPLNTGVFSATSLGEIGYSESDQLARWFGDSSVNALVILRGAEPVGFAMVARGSASPGKSPVDYRMAEFFVARTFQLIRRLNFRVLGVFRGHIRRYEVHSVRSSAANITL
jgi:predicted acetyltransferase